MVTYNEIKYLMGSIKMPIYVNTPLTDVKKYWLIHEYRDRTVYMKIKNFSDEGLLPKYNWNSETVL